MSKINFSIECEPGEFRKILRELLAGDPGSPATFAELKDQRQTPTVIDHVVGTTTQDPKPDGKKAGGARKPKDDTPVATASGGPAPSPTTPSPGQSAPEQSAGGAPTQPEGAVAATTSKKDPVAAAAAGTAAVSGLPDNIRTTNSMRDLLTYLREHGVDSMDAMVATCTVLQKDVPILAKVPKVEDRVRRACEVLQLFDKPAEEAGAAEATA